MAFWILAAGFLLLVAGSETVLRGGVAFARGWNMPALPIGLLVISASIAAPAFSVSLQAVLRQQPEIALASIVGGNILSLLLVVGLGALLRPLSSAPKVVLRDGGALLVAIAVLFFFLLDGKLVRLEALILLGGLIAYLVLIFFTDWRRAADNSVALAHAEYRLKDTTSMSGGFFMILFGLVSLFLGGRFTLSGGMALARVYEVSPELVGLTVVAFGTVLPLIVMTLAAALRGDVPLAAGQILISSVWNILGVLAGVTLVHAWKISPMLPAQDVPLMGASAVLLLALLSIQWRVGRGRGLLLVLAYGAYLVFLAWRQGLWTPATLGL